MCNIKKEDLRPCKFTLEGHMCWDLHISQCLIMKVTYKERKQLVHERDYFIVGVLHYTPKQKKGMSLLVA